MESREIHDLIPRLPLPVAQLVARTLNAKFPSDRHHNAYFLGEAALKLAAAARIGVWSHHACEPDSPLAEALEGLARPSAGTWLELLRRIDAALAKRVDAALLPLGNVAGAAAKEPHPAPALAALIDAAREEDILPASFKPDRGLLGSFGAFVAYRNKVLGHGGARSAETYERLWPKLLDAALEAIQSPAWIGGYRLAHVSVDYQGKRSWLGLSGTTPLPLREDWLDGLPPDAVVPDSLVLIGDGHVVSLHPLLVFLTEDERHFVHFLNESVVTPGKAAHDGGATVKKAEYLNYLNGKVHRADAHREALRAFFGRLHGRGPVSEHELARLEAGEAPDDDEASSSGGDDDVVGSGTFIDDYELVEKIGSGGMGEVYRARQRSLRRVVALKVLPREAAHDRTALERFRREIRALGKCEHPNVVKIFSSGEDAGRVYYTMELVDGADLGRVGRALSRWRSSGVSLDGAHLDAAVSLQPRPAADSHAERDPAKGDPELADVPEAVPAPPPVLNRGGDYYRRLAELFARAADGLAHLHDQGVIHRDVKPENLMLTADAARIVIMDLGLAKLTDSSLSLTQDKSKTLGTLMYMSPEQLQMQHLRVDHRTDVYGLGVCLYELACGRRFWKEGTHEQVMKQILMDEPVPPRKANPELPRDLATVIAKATAKNPEHRYATAAALAADLDAFAQLRPIAASPPGLIHRAGLFLRRHRTPAAATASALVVLLAGLALYFFAGPRVVRPTGATVKSEVQYCAYIEERRGVPFCAVPIPEERQKHRALTYRLQVVDGKVTRMDLINGSGELTDGTNYGRGGAVIFKSNSETTTFTYEYNSGGQVTTVVETNATGRFLRKWLYADLHRRDRVDAEGMPLRPIVLFWGRNLVTSGSLYTRELLTYDAKGCIQSIRYLNHFNLPQRNAELHWGYEFERDETCRIQVRYILDRHGLRNVDKKNVAKIQYTYDKQGNDSQISIYTVNKSGGFILTTDDGVAFTEYEYDRFGNTTGIRYFDARKNPVLSGARFPHMYASKISRYDDRGNAVEEWFRGTDNQPVVTKHRFSGWKLRYDEKGRIVAGTFLGTDGAPTLQADGIAGWEARYGENGEVAELRHLGLDGRLTLDSKGVAQVRFVFSQDAVETRNLGLDGKPVRDKSGYAISVLTRDRNGNPIRHAFFDVNRRPAPNNSGCASWRATYNEIGDLTEYFCLGGDGNPALEKKGFSSFRTEYDRQGNRVREWYYGTDGKPTLRRDGYAASRMAYDDNGYQTEKWYLGLDEKPILNKEGLAGVKTTFDERGNRVEQWFHGVDGGLVASSEGIAGWISVFNDRNQETERRYYGPDRKPAANRDGVFGWKDEYNDHGNMVRRQHLDAQGVVAPNLYRVAIVELTYDPNHNLVEERYLGSDQKPVLHGQRRIAGVRKKYAPSGNLAREENFGLDGTLTNDSTGTAYILYQYHPNHHRKSAVLYNQAGEMLTETIYDLSGEERRKDPSPPAPRR